MWNILVDVVKIRLQIQGEGGAVAAGAKPAGSRGLLNMFVHIARTEGILCK